MSVHRLFLGSDERRSRIIVIVRTYTPFRNPKLIEVGHRNETAAISRQTENI